MRYRATIARLIGSHDTLAVLGDRIVPSLKRDVYDDTEFRDEYAVGDLLFDAEDKGVP